MNRRAVDSDGRPGVDEKFNRRRAGAMGLASVGVAAIFVLALGVPGGPASAIGAPNGVESPVSTAPQPADDPGDEATPAPPDTAAPEVTRPPISANEFFPEDRDLTSCIGALERPGCGSESRGGWHQKYVLIALALGLLVVFGNVARGVFTRDKGNRAVRDQVVRDRAVRDQAIRDQAIRDQAVPDQRASAPADSAEQRRG